MSRNPYHLIALGSIVIAFSFAFQWCSSSTRTIAAADDCKCEDLPDLINRRNEVHAAIAAIRQQQVKLDADANQTGRPVPYSDDAYKLYLSNWINLAIDAAAAGAGKDVHRAHGPDGFTEGCSATSEATKDTACLWQGLAINEQARQDFCNTRLRGGADVVRGVVGGDWRARYPLRSFADVALKGYEAELTFLDQQIGKIMSHCNYGKWSGTVKVTWTRETVINISLPRPGENPATAPHGSDITRITENITSVFIIVNGLSYASGDVDFTQTENIDKSGKTACHGGMSGPKWTDFTYTSRALTQFGGSVFGHGEFYVTGPNSAGEYKVTIGTPGGYGRGTGSLHAEESGECAMKPVNNSSSIERKSLDSVHLAGDGEAKPTATELNTMYVSPAKTVTTNSTSQGTGTTTTSYTMDWDLKRSSPR